MEIPAQIVALGLPWELALAIGTILGAIVGSFLGTVAVRLPAGRSIVHGASACDRCHRQLRAAELVPIVSWLALRGRCRRCDGFIGWGQLAAEAGGAVVGALAWWAPDGLIVPALALGWQLLLLALLDARCLWLPWRLTAALAASGLALALWQGADALVPALLGAALGYALLGSVAWAYRKARGREGLGGGDPWLLGAIGAWVGPLGVVHVLLVAALLGLAVALVLHLSGKRIDAQTALPLGTFMALGAWPVFLLR
ncbi:MULTISPECIES: A24 family peptidase [unclassified Novosphingobium]|uniref:prepilin peptidase n=1 Tax=unclassified Novosphingobium TaxID=2644732 RepID=UPI0018018F0B|nr:MULTISPECIES: A24 family peptidase [unclassified Novosphingobium]NMN03693.1 leader peptidase (prepilin peptidase)/N-methyltransferase [Novosphingobium sp. SG919]NMN86317.1 leader peptidase (prepilin peptidase)/N-methyltransferase [Novosphingobium sp. SG916]